MQKCSTCKLELDFERFAANKSKKSGYNKVCKECQKKYKKQHYIDNQKDYIFKHRKRINDIKVLIRNYKSKNGCKYCLENHYCCLDFHHLESSQKEDTLAGGINRGWSIKKIFKEIEKCELICSNCHRKLHEKLFTGGGR